MATIEPTRKAYPFCLPLPVRSPKRNLTREFEAKRTAARASEKARRQKVMALLVQLDKTGRLQNAQNTAKVSLRGMINKRSCVACQTNILGGFFWVCEGCGAELCTACTHKKAYRAPSNVSLEVPLCQYCATIFQAVTDIKRFRDQVRKSDEHPLLVLRTQIINTSVSFMEEYILLNRLMKHLPDKETQFNVIAKCEESFRIVTVKSRKVVQLVDFIGQFQRFADLSQERIRQTIVRAFRHFQITVFNNTIDKMKEFEVIISSTTNLLDIPPTIFDMTPCVFPPKGGVLHIKLTNTRHLTASINGIPLKLDTAAMKVRIAIPPKCQPANLIDFALMYNGKPVNLPGPLQYLDFDPNEQPPAKHVHSAPKPNTALSETPVEQTSPGKVDTTPSSASAGEPEKKQEFVGKKVLIQVVEEEEESDLSDDSSEDSVSDDEDVVLVGAKKEPAPERLVASEHPPKQQDDKTNTQPHPHKHSDSVLPSARSLRRTTVKLDRALLETNIPPTPAQTPCASSAQSIRSDWNAFRRTLRTDRQTDRQTSPTHSLPNGLAYVSEDFGDTVGGIFAVPRVASITPPEFRTNAPQPFTITGSGFGQNPTVYFGATSVTSFDEVTPTTIRGVTPRLSTPGALTLAVENEFGRREAFAEPVRVVVQN